MTAEDVLRSLLVDAHLGGAVRERQVYANEPQSSPLSLVEDVRANPDVPGFSACTIRLVDGTKARLTLVLA